MRGQSATLGGWVGVNMLSIVYRHRQYQMWLSDQPVHESAP